MITTITLYILFTLIVLFANGKISYKLNLVDIPNKRKIHFKATAYTGGIAISVIFLIAVILFDTFNRSLSLILSIGFLISIVGFIDDKYNLNTGGKLSLQVIPIFYLLVFADLVLNDLGKYHYFELDLGTFALPFTLLCLLFLINAFNYFDGVDGLLSFTTITVIFILYFLALENSNHFLVKEQNIQFFLIILIIPIFLFIFFNFSFFNLPKLFLGDSGSLLFGFIISFLLIYFANQNFIHPILLAWSVSIFVYEFLSINIIRLKNKQMVFKAGKDHLHHILLEKNKSVFFTNLSISLLNIILFLIGYFSFVKISALASLINFITFFIIYFVLRDKFSVKN